MAESARERKRTFKLPRTSNARRSGRVSASTWLRRNRGALEAYNRQVEKDGVFSERLRSF